MKSATLNHLHYYKLIISQITAREDRVNFLYGQLKALTPFDRYGKELSVTSKCNLT